MNTCTTKRMKGKKAVASSTSFHELIVNLYMCVRVWFFGIFVFWAPLKPFVGKGNPYLLYLILPSILLGPFLPSVFLHMFFCVVC